MMLFLCLNHRFTSVLSFKGSAGQKHQRWTKRTVSSINKHTRFTETAGNDTQPQISTTLYKVPAVFKVFKGFHCLNTCKSGEDVLTPELFAWNELDW